MLAPVLVKIKWCIDIFKSGGYNCNMITSSLIHIGTLLKDGIQPDVENVPSKPSAARVIFFGSGKFLV